MPTAKKAAVSANAFAGQMRKPTEAELVAAIGIRKNMWDQLIAELDEQGAFDQQQWHSYSPKYGWSLRLIQKKRNILYMVPYRGYFQAAAIVGERALKTAKQSGLPAKLLKIIAAAPRYPEGTGIRIDVKTPADLKTVKALVAIKLLK
jgi:hypothetical protein